MTYVFVKLNYGFSISPRECSNSKRVQSNDQLHKYSRSIQKRFQIETKFQIESSNIRSSIKTSSSTLYIFKPNDDTSLSQGPELKTSPPMSHQNTLT